MPHKILIVDDELNEYKQCEKTLFPYSNDIKVLYANHGPAALNSIRENKPDLIFLDQQFNKENVGNENLFYEDNGSIVQHAKDDLIDEDHEYKQGLFIIRKIRELGYMGHVVFLTAYAEKNEIADKAFLLGGNNTDYTSKDRIKENYGAGLINLIEKKLSTKLIGFEERLKSIFNQYFNDISAQEEKLILNKIVNVAETKRRRRFDFGAAVIVKLKTKSKDVTYGETLNVLDNMLKEDEWKSEPVNPQEILQWVLAKVTNNMLPTKDQKEWNYIGHNTLRYVFKTSKDGKHYLLKIVHPKYSKEVVSFKSENKYQGIFPVLFCSSFKLEKNDPDWEGTDVVVYSEEMKDAKMLRVYYEDANTIGSLEADKIQKVLAGLADIMKNIPAGHGMIDLDSIYIVNGNLVRVADIPLWNSVNEEGHRMIGGLTLVDRKKRDIQALGVVGDFLISGTPGGIDSPNVNNLFLQFVVNCKNGTWDIICGNVPEPPFNTRFFSNGPFVNMSTEVNFAYFLKKHLLENNIKALVYLNTNVLLKKPIANEVDALVVRPGEIFWLDVKGNKFVTDKYYRSVQVTKIKQKTDLLKDLVGKMLLNPAFIIAYCVLEDPLFESVKSDLSDAESAVTRSYSGVISEIIGAKKQYYDLDSFISGFKDYIYSRYKSPYEEMTGFIEYYGNVVVGKSVGLFTELYSTEKPYYIRRYALNYVSDNILDYEYHKSFLEQSKKEKELINSLSSKYIAFPQEILFINSQNEMTAPSLEKTLSDGSVITVTNPDIRWIYKVYKKPGKDFECPLPLKDYLYDITEDKKTKLLFHYLEASRALLNSKCKLHFDRDSLKIYKNTKENEYVGVIEPIFTGNVQKKDILIIIDMLNDGKETFISLYNTVSKATDVNSVLEELIKKLTALIHHKEKYEDTKEYLKLDFLSKNPQPNKIQQPMSSIQEATPVGQLLNKTKDKTESSDSAQSTKNISNKKDERIEGTIASLRYSVEVEFNGHAELAELYSEGNSDIIGNIKIGDVIRIVFSRQLNKNVIRILRNQQQDNIKETAIIKSLPELKTGVIICDDKKYLFYSTNVTEHNRVKLYEAAKVSFVPFQKSNGKYFAKNVMLLEK